MHLLSFIYINSYAINVVCLSIYICVRVYTFTYIFRPYYRNVRGSSRTDAGVHAIRNCFHIDVDTHVKPGLRNPRAIVNGLNDALYKLDFIDFICITDAVLVDAEFDVRRDAVARTYMYRILNRNTRAHHSRTSVLLGTYH